MEGKTRIIHQGLFFLGVVLLISCSCAIKEPISIKKEKGAIVGRVKPIGINALVRAVQAVEVGRDVTDSQGYYRIGNLTAGVYILEVSAAGYGKYLKNNVIVFEGGTTAVEDIVLRPVPEQIDHTSPHDGQEDVSLSSSVYIYFTEKMDRASVESNLEITPTVEGTFKWTDYSGKSTLRYEPGSQLLPYTLYSVTIKRGAQTIYGDSLAFDYSFSFRTSEIKVRYVRPYDGDINVNTRSVIYLSFNARMNTTSVEKAFSITPALAGNFSWDYDGDAFRYEPWQRLLSPGTAYTVTIDTTAKDINGYHLLESFSFSFTTESLKITYYSPPDGATYVDTLTSISIEFNALMDQASVENAFSITPSVGGNFWWHNYYLLQFKPTSSLSANTTYIVKIDSTCQDIDGHHLPNTVSFSFKTRP